MNIVAVHSSKGGSGKTFLVGNIGNILASIGKKCVIVDCDIAGPSFNDIFSRVTKPRSFINDILLGNCSTSKVLCSTGIKNLDIIFADPNPTIGEGMLTFEHSTYVDALRNLSLMMSELRQLKYDVVILDTTPGLNPLSVNALLISQNVVIVVRPDSYSLRTTNHILRTLYTKLKDSALGSKKYSMIFNQVPYAQGEEISNLLENYVKEIQAYLNIDVLGVINCLCREAGYNLIKNPLLDENNVGIEAITSITKKLLEI